MSAVVQTPELWVRPMQDSDLDDVMRVELSVYGFPWTRRIFEDCLRVGYHCHVGEVAGDFAGYGIMSTGANEAHILNLCVSPHYQRHGLGRKLMSVLLAEAHQRDVRDVFLEVRPSNTAALALYEQMGFNQVGARKNYYPTQQGREDAVILAASLDF
jgi:ribosomal-protein-alanine N-acetyltransferase